MSVARTASVNKMFAALKGLNRQERNKGRGGTKVDEVMELSLPECLDRRSASSLREVPRISFISALKEQ